MSYNFSAMKGNPSHKVPESRFTFPRLASIKLDGLRIMTQDTETRMIKKGQAPVLTQVVTSGGMTLPNKEARDLLENLPKGLDGELKLNGVSFSEASKVLMAFKSKREFEPKDLEYHVFNYCPETGRDSSYNSRILLASQMIHDYNSIDSNLITVKLVPQTPVNNHEDSLIFFEKCVAAGEEGAMLLDPEAGYVEKRSHSIIKMKDKLDKEYRVIGFEEMHYGDNLKTVPERLWGQPKDTLGALVLETPSGHVFTCGSGFSLEERKGVWGDKERYLGLYASVSYLPLSCVNAPRHPIFKKFRTEPSGPDFPIL